MGKELLNLLSVESPIDEKDLINPDLLGIRKADGSADIPVRYEDEFLKEFDYAHNLNDIMKMEMAA